MALQMLVAGRRPLVVHHALEKGLAGCHTHGFVGAVRG